MTLALSRVQAYATTSPAATLRADACAFAQASTAFLDTRFGSLMAKKIVRYGWLFHPSGEDDAPADLTLEDLDRLGRLARLAVYTDRPDKTSEDTVRVLFSVKTLLGASPPSVRWAPSLARFDRLMLDHPLHRPQMVSNVLRLLALGLTAPLLHMHSFRSEDLWEPLVARLHRWMEADTAIDLEPVEAERLLAHARLAKSPSAIALAEKLPAWVQRLALEAQTLQPSIASLPSMSRL